MDGGVELSVAAAAEPVSVCAAGPDRRWGGAVMTSECVTGFEAFDAGDLADQLCCGEWSHSVDASQIRCCDLGAGFELGAQVVDVDGELADTDDQVGRDASDHAVELSNSASGDVELLERGEGTQVWSSCRVDLMEMPAEPVDVPGPFRHQVFSMIDEQSNLAGLSVEVGCREVRFAERSSCNGERVDWVGYITPT